MRILSLLRLSCVLLLPCSAQAEPTWEETVGWLKDKFVSDGPYVVQSREWKHTTYVYETKSIVSDGCNLTISRRSQILDAKNEEAPVEWFVEYVFPVKNYHRLEVDWHRNHGYKWINVFSSAKDVRTSYTDSGEWKHMTDGDLELYIDIDAYPDFLKRLDAALKWLSTLARANAACGKPEAF